MTCTSWGHTSNWEDVTFRPTCDFHLTLIYCKYRLKCVGLPVLKCQSISMRGDRWGKVKGNGKKSSFHRSHLFFSPSHLTEMGLSESCSTLQMRQLLPFCAGLSAWRYRNGCAKHACAVGLLLLFCTGVPQCQTVVMVVDFHQSR